jgi:hypothetical protein
VPNLGVPELLIILVGLILIGAVFIGLILLAVRLAGGRRPPSHSPDLAERARALKASGHVERAVMLVRGETGMNHQDASDFVHRL